ncbi:unnamed protein product, partial [marine sediment metagenome]
EIANESLILGGSNDQFDDGATRYNQIMGAGGPYTGTENDVRQVIPTAGTIKDFYVKLNIDPGTAPDAYTLTVRWNGATVAQSLIVTIVADATTGNDLVHNLVVAPYDRITLMVTPVSSPAEMPIACWGMTFVADVDGESVVLGGSNGDLDDTATEYHFVTPPYPQVWTANEAFRHMLGQVCTITKLHIKINDVPGAGNSYTFTLRVADAASNVVAVVTGAASTIGNSGALEDTVANDEYMGLHVVPDDTPTVRDAYWGFVSYRQPG